MAVKANLKIILKADNTVVAESDDATLWQKVLVFMNSGGILTDNQDNNATKGKKYNELDDDIAIDDITKFAKELGVTKEVLQGACSPRIEAPYIYLDKHHWESLKKSLPERGAKSIADIVIAATLLILWKEKANLGNSVSSKEASAVLATIGLNAKNPTRSIENCEWLQMRGKQIILNPAQTSKAIKIAKAYCLKEDPYSKE